MCGGLERKMTGIEVLRGPLRNKGTAFTLEEFVVAAQAVFPAGMYRAEYR